MIDWSPEQPTNDDAALDALRTERNAAVAEAKLWLKRLIDMQQERDDWRADAAMWEKAYNDLLQQFRRLEVEANAIRFDYDQANSVVDFIIAARGLNAGMAAPK